MITTVLRLIRFPNLLVVALTQYLVAKEVLGAAFASEGLQPALNDTELVLLLLATACVTAAGYALNDLLDVEIDRINRPDKVLVGRRISERNVRILIAIFSIAGLLLSSLLAYQKDELEWLWLYPFFLVLLGGYPRLFKSRPFAGNLLVAVCCAGVAGLVWLAERSPWRSLTEEGQAYVSFVLILFMGYAFLATWTRELVKDLEDLPGDRAQGRRTLPVIWGETGAKRLIQLLTLALGVALLYSLWMAHGVVLNITIPSLLLVLLGLSWQLWRAQSVQDFHRLSTLWKFYLLGGLLLLYLY